MAFGGLHQLSALGQSVWMDNLSRDALLNGQVDTYIQDKSIRGITTNPTIFFHAISHSHEYDTQLASLASWSASPDEAARQLVCEDVRRACDHLIDVYSDSSFIDGYVSIEVDPRMAYDTAATIGMAQQLAWLVDRPNVMVKIPATTEGIAAVRACTALGINVNVTLIFSEHTYERVVTAYMDGLEMALENGVDVSRLQSVASIFLNWVDEEANMYLRHSSVDLWAVRNLVATSNARSIYDRSKAVVQGARWRKLESAGAHPQRILWAATRVKNEKLDECAYVHPLAISGTVNTMTPELLSVVDNREVPSDGSSTVMDPQTIGARRRFEQSCASLEALGSVLEQRGVRLFTDSWVSLVDLVATRMAKYAPPAN